MSALTVRARWQASLQYLSVSRAAIYRVCIVTQSGPMSRMCRPGVMTAEEIHQAIMETGVRNVTLTGGEPLDRPYISELLEKLAADHSLHVEIETNGSVSLAPFVNIPNRPSFTMDYKLSW